MDHDELGKEMACWIRLEKGQKFNVDQMRAFLRSKVPDSHLSAHDKFVESFPMASVAKYRSSASRRCSPLTGAPQGLPRATS
ncbi:hypothetical protein DFAR_2530003 [Desulfarculales bacterium]